MALTKADQENWDSTFKVFKRNCTTGLEDQEIEDIMKLLHRHDRGLGRIYAIYCNDPLSPAQKADHKEKENRLINRVGELVKKLGFKYEINSDPRGYSVQIILPDGNHNNLGGNWTLCW